MYIHIIYTQVGVADAVCDQENEGAPDQGAGLRVCSLCMYICVHASSVCVYERPLPTVTLHACMYQHMSIRMHASRLHVCPLCEYIYMYM